MIDFLSYTLKYQGKSISQYNIVIFWCLRIDSLSSRTGTVYIYIFFYYNEKSFGTKAWLCSVIFLNYLLYMCIVHIVCQFYVLQKLLRWQHSIVRVCLSHTYFQWNGKNTQMG